MELYNIAENADKRLSEAEMFTRRFGTFSKSDYETLLFTIFLDSLDSPARDYDISIFRKTACLNNWSTKVLHIVKQHTALSKHINGV